MISTLFEIGKIYLALQKVTWRSNVPSNKTKSLDIYVLHNLQGHLSISQFLILDLNVDKDASSL